jgi:spermidine synthase
MSPLARALVYLLFLLSGATALVYEVAWSRRLVLVLGSTTYAVSLILAAYMLGLALGARLSGSVADRTRSPLLLYAVLEAGIGGLAFLMPVLLSAASAAAGGSRPLAFLFGFAVLLLPTTLMGATLPILSRFVVTRLGVMGSRIGLLYGLNTAGAVIGTFLAGFFLVRLLGVYTSTYFAGVANLLIAGVAVALALQMRDVAREPSAEPPAVPSGPPGALPRIALLAALASGLLSLASEVLWMRMLTFFLEGFTYTFSAMLTTFLLGLAVGAVISGALVSRIRNLRRYLGWLFLLSALVSAGVLFAMVHAFDLTRWANDVTAPLFANWRVHHAARLFLVSFLVLFPPALLMGTIFPAAARMATRHVGEVGGRVGLVYAVNTLGAVLGSLVAGLALVPMVGMAWGAAGVAFAGALVGLAMLGRRALAALPVAAGVVALVFLAEPWTEFVLRSQVFQGRWSLERELITYREGAYAAVSVVEDRRDGVRAIYTDDFQAAATGPAYKYMRLLAHIPLLIADRWEGSEVLVICFGTGTTAGSASAHPLGRLDLVEICPEVLELAPRFRDVNKGILDRDADRPFPVAVHVDDGRNFLLRSERTWDVITLEPLMPYTPGAVNLYTEDFYRLCRGRLAENGVMCQWIPIHAMSSDDYKMLLRSFVEVFPETTLWFVEGTTMVIGTREPTRIDFGRLASRMRRTEVAEDLEAIEFDDPLLVLNSFVAGGEELSRFLEDAFVMTDERPLMEFHPIPYGFPNTYSADNLAVLHGLRKPVNDSLDPATLPAEGREELLQALDRCYRGGQAFLEARHFKERSAYHGAMGDEPAQLRMYQEAMRAFDEAVELNPRDASARYLRKNAHYGWLISVGRLELEEGRLAEAEESFRQAARLGNPFKPDLAWTYLGKALNRRGRHAEALAALEQALHHFPKSPTAALERGYARYGLGDMRGANEDFESAFGRPVEPEVDGKVMSAVRRVRNMAEKGLLHVPREPGEEVRELLAELRRAARPKRPALMSRLRGMYEEDAERVLSALAEDVARARDPERPEEEQLFALNVLVGLGDLPGTLDLLRTGTRAVRGRAADVLGLVKKKPVIPALISAMEDPERDVREAAWAALFMLTGKRPLGYDPGGPDEERAVALVRLREWWGEVEAEWKFSE